MLFLEHLGSARCLFQRLDSPDLELRFITMCWLATDVEDNRPVGKTSPLLRQHCSKSCSKQLHHSQHLEYFHVAAQDPVSLGTELDAHGAAGGADHQAVDQVGLAVVAHASCHLLVGRVVALHFHVDLVGSDNNWFEAGFSQGGLLRDQVRTRVKKAEGEVGLSVALLLAAIPNFLQAWRIVPAEC